MSHDPVRDNLENWALPNIEDHLRSEIVRLNDALRRRDAEVERLVEALRIIRAEYAIEISRQSIPGDSPDETLAMVDALLREYTPKENKLKPLIDRFDGIDMPEVSGRLEKRDE